MHRLESLTERTTRQSLALSYYSPLKFQNYYLPHTGRTRGSASPDDGYCAYVRFTNERQGFKASCAISGISLLAGTRG